MRRDDPAAFERKVREALGHLNDPGRLQLHPLAQALPAGRNGFGEGRALQRELREAIDALRPGRVGRARGHALLTLRYVEGLEVAEVQARLGIARAHYFREQARAVAAVAAVLRERWGAAVVAPPTEPAGLNDRTPGRLPVPLSTFVGREREAAAVGQLLLSARLVTLTGAPGAGKTRLSIEIAGSLRSAFVDGVYFVRLAPVRSDRLVLPTIARALGVETDRLESLGAQVAAALASRRVLLVLDNVEHVVAAATDVADLVAACPNLAVLATSRRPLRVSGEHELPVPPLPLPPKGVVPTFAAAAASDAVRLFVDRARAIDPDFVLDEANAAMVASICARVDGLPLGIELAAARTRVLPLGSLLERLGDRLPLLIGGLRDADDRHRTLRQAIGWSYDLLDPPERLLFRRLGVFVGGAALGDVDPVCSEQVPGPPALDCLGALIESGLLGRHEGGDGEPRFTLMETIREYALERLAVEDDASGAHERHASHFLEVAEESMRHGRTPRQTGWLDRLERERANLGAALAWWVGRQDAPGASRLAGAMWTFWAIRGDATEGREALDEVLALPGADAPTQARAMCLRGAGRLALNQGDLVAAHRAYEAALGVAREIGDPDTTRDALNGLGRLAMERRDHRTARVFLEESLVVARRAGLNPSVVSVLGLLNLEEGDLAAARRCFEEALSESRRRGDEAGVATAFVRLGHAAHAEGDHDRARALYEESLRMQRGFGDQRALALVLANLGMVAADQGDGAAARAALVEAASVARDLRDLAGVALALEGFAGLAAADGEAGRAVSLERAARAARRGCGAARPRGVEQWLERWLHAVSASVASSEAPPLPEDGARPWERAVDDLLNGRSGASDTAPTR